MVPINAIQMYPETLQAIHFHLLPYLKTSMRISFLKAHATLIIKDKDKNTAAFGYVGRLKVQDDNFALKPPQAFMQSCL